MWTPELELDGQKAIRDADFFTKQKFFKELFVAATSKGDETHMTTAFGEVVYDQAERLLPSSDP